ncbi:MAG: Gfo/Idh/MocA family oxidoreductase [Clostridia bacterium]
MENPIRTAIVGAGNRGRVFGEFARKNPGLMKICAVAEPNDYRREKLAGQHGIPENMRFKDLEGLLGSRPSLDGIINTTMDPLHYQTSMDILEAGYPMLLEKPICLDKNELFDIYRLARSKKLTVMICHVLRYAPFYAEIKKILNSGAIGTAYAIQTEENVSYHHLAAAFIRGKWSNSETCGSPMLMSKCCHDLDILTFMKSGVAPRYVSSMGNLFQFMEKNAPQGSGRFCLLDCNIEEECIYSARKMYIDNKTWEYYSTEFLHGHPDMDTAERKTWGMKNGNPFGRCVWRCDNNIVDHQAVIVEFEDGCVATHNLTGGTSKPCRSIHITGTRGEILGVMEDGVIHVRTPDLSADNLYKETVINLNLDNDGHGGGDERLAEDFARVLSGEGASLSTTTLEDSIYGHLIGFQAHEAMTERKVCMIEKVWHE